jgi:uncharacterized protein with GYD domain
MPKYMVEATYTAEGLKGLAKDKATGRVKSVTAAISGLGGTVEAFYYAFGHRDAIVIADLPDNVSCAALSLAAASSGLVNIQTTPLLTPEEVDRALKLKTKYQAPGKAR